MGGNLLKDITRRQSTKEYLDKANEVIALLSRNTHELDRIVLIQAYYTKETFGDADIVYCTSNDVEFSVVQLSALFNPTKIVKNGSVISFDYKEMQVDLIHSAGECFYYALSYFSYNDLGNFIGKLARYFGLSHGHKGLYLPLREPDGNLIDSILVSTDHDATLNFVGLDPDVFNKGFDTMEDVYRYVQSSPFFNPESYKLENVSSIGRIRDRKRESYRNFLLFNENYDGPTPPVIEDKNVFLERIFTSFPGTELRFTEVMQKYAFTKAVREKFNGDVVKTLTCLENQELGVFIKHIRHLHNFKPAVLMYLSQERINKNIMKEYDVIFNWFD